MFLMSITLFLDFSLIPAKYRLFQDEKKRYFGGKGNQKNSRQKREENFFWISFGSYLNQFGI